MSILRILNFFLNKDVDLNSFKSQLNVIFKYTKKKVFDLQVFNVYKGCIEISKY